MPKRILHTKCSGSALCIAVFHQLFKLPTLMKPHQEIAATHKLAIDVDLRAGMHQAVNLLVRTCAVQPPNGLGKLQPGCLSMSWALLQDLKDLLQGFIIIKVKGS